MWIKRRERHGKVKDDHIKWMIGIFKVIGFKLEGIKFRILEESSL